ncbi:penicillin-binding protein 2 [Caldimonas thermodepolymerans]|jgi:penicillin-binding protein 2|uniref:Peptidoglycan D,D-transpeptidase MrdA n=1 Tax=Caldimonas thermodepolymerans TaxID=215580 RepID=A0A2S5T4U1_9BURK|nr:penicillin-binding protein 2 [Caldimonas thermodepolymerans]PPE70001.1 penicillin-binding protein 2 [Caldimonas thermodepolymerans]QPC31741.1 penicillin-binding protein 2 [Caldimonas thermodepolymerans]RDI01756.1 peptidoglycan glycosyltransferase /cell elongation-specific peptidoglycan D,D-transpeptidase [Caldimonas thermodepolymerans]TCP05893.1 peptidoglycan glycosyltransferase /cell elongation-specific peptidoglycan D,D-transpeptidase [Caldimonas thermodepolymerans]UZG48169.1 penicillin-b
MTELKNVELELSRFRARVLFAAAMVLVCFGLIFARLAYLQVIRYDELSTRAENNRIAVVPIVPNRGLIVDRNGVVLANNYSAYTLELTPSKIADLDATIDALSEVVEITNYDRRRFRRLMDESKSFESLPIRTRLTDEEVARFSVQAYRFPGVEIKARLFRHYPLGEIGSHVIGYIGRINQAEKEKIEDSEDAANYRGTDYIGKLGIEQSYERELHGITGFEEVETSAGGRAVRRLRSSPAIPGNTVVLSIDIKLQALVERLYGNRRGALVAIDPKTGELLAFVSKPTFDPNLFVEGIDVENWRALNESPDKPLLNRALRGTYPPGSTFKPFMAMAALNSGKRGPNEAILDTGVFLFGNHRFRSHGDVGLGMVDMHRSIVKSSNVYYYSLANEMGVDLIHAQLAPFGFGQITGIDIEGEVRGVLPSTEWKRRAYKKPEQQRWYAGETISLGIGQGYNNFTMLQLSHALATLVSGGERHVPHLVREIRDVVTRERRPVGGQRLEPLDLKAQHVEIIKRAMHAVTQEGTSTRVFAGAPYASGGKTGTAQAVTIRQNEKYNAAKMAEYLRDHSLYIAFAPVDDPQIAVALIVENAGFGAQAAAPIARRVLDYWLAGIYPSEEDILAVQNGQAAAPIGTPRRASEVQLPAPVLPATGSTVLPVPAQAVPASAVAPVSLNPEPAR